MGVLVLQIPGFNAHFPVSQLFQSKYGPGEPLLQARASINDCGDSTFINQSTGGSPLVADCQHLARNIAGGGTWKVTFTDSQHQLAQYGTCAFGIEGDNPMNTAYVGNQDIIDVINTSIAKFQWEGKIGTKGTMACQSQKGIMGTPLMTWGTITTEPQL